MQVVETLGELIKVGQFLYRKYLEGKYIRPNSFKFWLSQYQLFAGNTIFFAVNRKQLTFTVTACFKRNGPLPAEVNFPTQTNVFKSSSAELIMLASESTGVTVLKHLVEVCCFVFYSQGAKDLFIQVTEEFLPFYRKIGFSLLAKGSKHHFYLQKTPFLLHFPLNEWQERLPNFLKGKVVWTEKLNTTKEERNG